MTLYKDPIIRRKIIMERYSTPKHVGKISGIEPVERFSTQCVDKFKLYLKWDGEVLKDIKHISVGCAVFLSSLDLFIDYIKGKTKSEIINVTKNYDVMINKMGKYDKDLLDKLTIFDNVKTHLNRLLCANMVSEFFKEELI